MIGIGTSLLFDRRAGKGGSPIPPFNKAMVDAWFMSGSRFFIFSILLYTEKQFNFQS